MPKGGLSFEGGLDAAGLRLAVLVARFNAHVTGPLYDGCSDELRERGLDPGELTSIEVPGCFELPLVAKALAETGRYDAVICLGAVIRGDTPHFDYVAGNAASGLAGVSVETGVPIAFGILTTNSVEQAVDRAGAKSGNKGFDAAMTAIEMTSLLRKLRSPGQPS